MNYETATDFEINKAVAEAQGYLVMEMQPEGSCGMTAKFHHDYPDTVWVAEHEHFVQTKAWEQYCPTKDPSDAWPIILENRIQLRATQLWYAAWGDDGWTVDYETENHENPLRCAMIAFLKMQGDKR
tara:strand:+ start:169 stop:549 length:381 start_codon:yes stop_codon:yes gene_type:complete